jgi:hypothetical protein
MDQPKFETITPNVEQTFSGKDMVIAVLVSLLVFSFLGINLLANADAIIKYITDIFKPFLQMLGYSAGTLINKTSDVAADTTKIGVDIAEGSIKNIGNLLIDASDHELETTIDKPKLNKVNQPESDSTANPIQNPIAKSKGGWCLIGEVSDRRGCISVKDEAKCMSGQVFPTQKMCLNPNITPN